MLDLADFITDRGGDPKKIKESQRRRFAPEEAVDEVISLYEDARRGKLLIALCYFTHRNMNILIYWLYF
jgi:seryl-tRNA synthetase